MTFPLDVVTAYPGRMEPDTDPQRDLNAGVDPARREAGRSWARAALQRAREAYDPEARERTRLEIGLPPSISS